MRWTNIITSQREENSKFNKKKRQTREGADETGEVKDRAGVNCQEEEKEKVLLP